MILVAGASPAYATGMRAVLKAGIVNILITDHVTGHVTAELLMRDEI